MVKTKCLYLHGLDSQPMREKDDILLANFEHLVSPKINYRRENIFSFLCAIVEEREIGCIVGSSFGGFMAYHLARKYALSVILFNPALAYYQTNPDIINEFDRVPMKKCFVAIGQEDDVVPPQSTLDYLKSSNHESTFFHVEIIEKLGHRIPLDVLENTIRDALNKFLD